MPGPPDPQRPDHEPAGDLPGDVCHDQHADPQSDSDAAARAARVVRTSANGRSPGAVPCGGVADSVTMAPFGPTRSLAGWAETQRGARAAPPR